MTWFVYKRSLHRSQGKTENGLSLPFRTAGGNAAADCEIIAPHYVEHANTSVSVTDCPSPAMQTLTDAGNSQEEHSGVGRIW